MIYDCVIIGRGPAGLQCALYLARASYKVLVVGKEPNLSKSDRIENYFGVKKIDGEGLLAIGEEQAKDFGTELMSDEVVGLDVLDNKLYSVNTKKDKFRCKSIVLAVGLNVKKTGILKEEDFFGKGVHYCVSCDGNFYRDKKVAVIGAADYAAYSAIELMKYTNKVRIFTNGLQPEFSDEIQKELKLLGIEVNQNLIESYSGSNFLDGLIMKEGPMIPINGVFIALGTASALDFAMKIGIVMEGNYVKVNELQETNVPGIFACGDCTKGFAQIARAVGEGCIASKTVIDYLKKF